MLTYEFKLRPNKKQESALLLQLQLTMDLYNEGLSELVEHYKSSGKHLNVFAHGKNHGKLQHPRVPAVLVDTTIKRLHYSFSNFFRRCKLGESKKGFPRFKTRRQWNSIQFRDSVSNGISGSYFKAGKIMGGNIRFNKHRDIVGLVKFCRIVRKPSGWLLQVVCEAGEQYQKQTGLSVGLDFGINHLIADSNGNKIENPRFLKKSLRKLRVAQRRIARRQVGSNRRKKAGRIAARIHERIANQRRDYIHKTAREYVNKYDAIFIEDLSVSSMSKNRCLSRSISDASWAMLRRVIESKAESAGKRVIAVPPQFTSQWCSECGEIVQKSLSVRTHVCPHCGYSDCRDTNAAKNILRLGCSLQGGAAIAAPVI